MSLKFDSLSLAKFFRPIGQTAAIMFFCSLAWNVLGRYPVNLGPSHDPQTAWESIILFGHVVLLFMGIPALVIALPFVFLGDMFAKAAYKKEKSGIPYKKWKQTNL